MLFVISPYSRPLRFKLIFSGLQDLFFFLWKLFVQSLHFSMHPSIPIAFCQGLPLLVPQHSRVRSFRCSVTGPEASHDSSSAEPSVSQLVSPGRRLFLSRVLSAVLLVNTPSVAEESKYNVDSSRTGSRIEPSAPSATRPNPPKGPKPSKNSVPKWSYTEPTGPPSWGQLSPDYYLASSGQMQSPIPVSYRSAITNRSVARPSLTSNPATFTFRLRDFPAAANPYLVLEQYLPPPPPVYGDVPPMDLPNPPPPPASITYDSATYVFRSVQFHAGASEHTIDNVSGAAEIQFVFERRPRQKPPPPPSSSSKPSGSNNSAQTNGAPSKAPAQSKSPTQSQTPNPPTESQSSKAPSDSQSPKLSPDSPSLAPSSKSQSYTTPSESSSPSSKGSLDSSAPASKAPLELPPPSKAPLESPPPSSKAPSESSPPSAKEPSESSPPSSKEPVEPTPSKAPVESSSSKTLSESQPSKEPLDSTTQTSSESSKVRSDSSASQASQELSTNKLGEAQGSSDATMFSDASASVDLFTLNNASSTPWSSPSFFSPPPAAAAETNSNAPTKPHTLIVSLIARRGFESTPWLATLLSEFSKKAGADGRYTVLYKDLNISTMLKDFKTSDLYVYSGSLTTPPCTEGVLWVVMRSRCKISIDDTKTILRWQNGRNIRPMQDINSRTVIRFPPGQYGMDTKSKPRGESKMSASRSK